jgi:hypothetical protein
VRRQTMTALLVLGLVALPAVGCGDGGASRAAARSASEAAARRAESMAGRVPRGAARTPGIALGRPIETSGSASSRAGATIERLASQSGDHRRAACRSVNAHAYAESTPPEQAYTAVVTSVGYVVPYTAFLEMWTSVAQLSDGDADALASLLCAG